VGGEQSPPTLSLINFFMDEFAQKLNRGLTESGFTIKDNHWVFASEKGQMEIALAGDAVSGRWTQKDGYVDCLFFEKHMVPDLFFWIKYYQAGQEFTRKGTIGYQNSDPS